MQLITDSPLSSLIYTSRQLYRLQNRQQSLKCSSHSFVVKKKKKKRILSVYIKHEWMFAPETLAPLNLLSVSAARPALCLEARGVTS